MLCEKMMTPNDSLTAHLEPMDTTRSGYPFIHDLYHMGIQMGRNHYIMFPNHKDEDLKYFILVDTRTGSRVKVVIHG